MSEPRCWIETLPGREGAEAICFSGLSLLAYEGIALFAAERETIFLGAPVMRQQGGGVPYLRVGVQPGNMDRAISLMQRAFDRFAIVPPLLRSTPYLTATELEQMRGSLSPQRFREQYQVALPTARHDIRVVINVDTRAVERALRQVQDGCERLGQELRGRMPELRQQVEELERRARRLNADVLQAIAQGSGRDGRSTVAPKSRRCCASCSYFMRGFKPGEPHICNAFHAIGDIQAETDCSDWE